MIVRELINLIRFSIDKKDLTKAQLAFKKFKQGLVRAAKAIGVAVLAIGALAIKSASASEEAFNKFTVVFDGVLDKAVEMRNELRDFYGMSETEATQALSTFQDFLVPMGIARDKGLELSGAFNKLAADLGSFNDVPTGQVLEALKSGLAGMSRPMRQYGVDISETTLRAMAQARGIALVNGVLDRQSRAMLILEKVQMDSKDAMGDFIRTSDSFANSLKIMKARVDDVLTTLGTALLPSAAKIIVKLTSIIKNNLVPMLEKILPAILPIFEAIINLIEPLFQLLMPIFDILATTLNLLSNIISKTLMPFIVTLTNMFIPLLSDFGAILSDLFIMLEPLISIILNLLMITIKKHLYPFLILLKIIFAFLKPLMRVLNTILTPFLDALLKIMEVINKLIDAMFLLFYDVIGKAVDWVILKLGSVGGAFKGIFTGISDFFTKIINNVIDGINFLISATNKVAKTKIELIEKLDPSKLATKDVTNNNQKQVNVNLKNNINVSGMKDAGQVKEAIQKTAGSVFNLELKKLLIDAGGL